MSQGDLDISRRLREQAAREQELEREISRLKSNINILDRNKTEMRSELEHRDERLSRLGHELNQYKTELSRLQKTSGITSRPSEYQFSAIELTGITSSPDREAMHLKRQNESLRMDVEAIRKERDEAIRDNRKLTSTISLSRDAGIGIGSSMEDIYKRLLLLLVNTISFCFTVCIM
jgi:chromosome segregation ATPase